MKRVLLSTYMMLLVFGSFAQVRLQALADTNKILIGEQFTVMLSATIPKGTDFTWPTADSLDGLELIKASTVDTTLLDQRWELRQKLTLSAFDSGYFAFPPQNLLLGSSVYQSEALPIAVLLPDVKENQELFDIKGVEDVPFNWWRITAWIAGIIAVLVGLFFLIKRLFRKKPKEPKKAVVPAMPPYQWAVAELQKIEKAQLWQAGEIKRYYSEVTDVARQYMERALAINAMESTAFEIKQKLKPVDVDESAKAKMNEALYLSEMVKFAKEQPGRDQHEKTMSAVYTFVEATKPKPIQP